MVTFHNYYLLKAPGAGALSDLCKQVIEKSLQDFFLAYSYTTEIVDDRWYYSNLRETIYDEEGETVTAWFNCQQELWNFYRDPSEFLNNTSVCIAEMLESVIELNEEEIEELYNMRVFDDGFTKLVYHENFIRIVF